MCWVELLVFMVKTDYQPKINITYGFPNFSKNQLSIPYVLIKETKPFLFFAISSLPEPAAMTGLKPLTL
jgi:hypothetical protein